MKDLQLHTFRKKSVYEPTTGERTLNKDNE